MSARRIVCISLPQFPIERMLRHRPELSAAKSSEAEAPLVLWREATHGPVIHAVSEAAREAGIGAGVGLTDARAVCPTLHGVPADTGGDARALRQLSLWMRRFSPWTAVDGQGLVLDASGAAHLWGGEAGMLAAIQTALADLGHGARLAMAPTWGAAWALARFGADRAIAHDSAALLPLPVAALRLSPATVQILRRLGLRTVGDLARLPRLSLTRRFRHAAAGDNPLIRLDQATGQVSEPLNSVDPPPQYRAQSRLPEPILDPTHYLPGLCAALCDDLAAAGMAARRLRLMVWRVDGETRWIDAGIASASRDPAHIARLFRERLERIDAGFGFDLIELSALRVEPSAALQTDLTQPAQAGPDLPQLIDRLSARYGEGCVVRPIRRASHIPERALAEAPPLSPPPPPAEAVERPLRMYWPPQEIGVLYGVPEGPPVRFRWQGRVHEIAKWQGPERIAPEWWVDRPGTRLRDYYRVEDKTGRRLWIYREGVLGDNRGGLPRWLVQGEFA